MFLKNAWYIAAWSNELEGAPLARRILDEPLVFFRDESGKAVALVDRCSHRAAPLSLGRCEAGTIRCMYHGVRFDGRGECVEVPGQDNVPKALRIRAWPVVERDHLLWIWMGDPARADPADIPDTSPHNSGLAARGGYIHYNASHRLIADNLLDFSHLAFVHSNTLGTSSQASTKAKVEKFDGGVHVRFVTLGGQQPGFARSVTRLPDVVDRYQFYSWHVRSCYFVQDSLIAAAGDGPDTDNPLALRNHTINVLTPETATTTHFFWSIAHSDFNPGNDGVTDLLKQQVARAFEEDKVMIEAQQRRILDDPAAPMMAIAADRALVEVRRMEDRMIAEEALAA